MGFGLWDRLNELMIFALARFFTRLDFGLSDRLGDNKYTLYCSSGVYFEPLQRTTEVVRDLCLYRPSVRFVSFVSFDE